MLLQIRSHAQVFVFSAHPILSQEAASHLALTEILRVCNG